MQHRHHRKVDARLAPLGITLVQWDALRAISRHPNASSHRLAHLTFQTDQPFGALAGQIATSWPMLACAAGHRPEETAK